MDKRNSHSEPELLRLVAKGDKDAYQEIFRRYWSQVYGTCLRLTKSPEFSKDLAQEIFLKLWDHRLKLPDVKKLDAYLYTISRNQVLDYLRKNVLAPSHATLLEDYFSYNTPGPQQRLEFLELEKSVKEAVDRLPPQLKTAFTLSRDEGLSHEQIARQMGISRVSSKAYIVRALTEIRKYLSAHADKPIR
ncbi:MAG: sigma-70 family RNA polymerase sigma factor [Puia sp.]|nr:sigma-70 family RNA polymerase sigma factor [Puia sp.]